MEANPCLEFSQYIFQILMCIINSFLFEWTHKFNENIQIMIHISHPWPEEINTFTTNRGGEGKENQFPPKVYKINRHYVLSCLFLRCQISSNAVAKWYDQEHPRVILKPIPWNGHLKWALLSRTQLYYYSSTPLRQAKKLFLLGRFLPREFPFSQISFFSFFFFFQIWEFKVMASFYLYLLELKFSCFLIGQREGKERHIHLSEYPFKREEWMKFLAAFFRRLLLQTNFIYNIFIYITLNDNHWNTLMTTISFVNWFICLLQ